jgi:putative transposase
MAYKLTNSRKSKFATDPEYVEHYQRERPHQGKGNVVLVPTADHGQQRGGPVRCRERLGGLLHFYNREAA